MQTMTNEPVYLGRRTPLQHCCDLLYTFIMPVHKSPTTSTRFSTLRSGCTNLS